MSKRKSVSAPSYDDEFMALQEKAKKGPKTWPARGERGVIMAHLWGGERELGELYLVKDKITTFHMTSTGFVWVGFLGDDAESSGAKLATTLESFLAAYHNA